MQQKTIYISFPKEYSHIQMRFVKKINTTFINTSCENPDSDSIIIPSYPHDQEKSQEICQAVQY